MWNEAETRAGQLCHLERRCWCQRDVNAVDEMDKVLDRHKVPKEEIRVCSIEGHRTRHYVAWMDLRNGDGHGESRILSRR